MSYRSRMSNAALIAAGCLTLVAGGALSQTKPDPPAPRAQHANKHPENASSDRGEQVFKQNCSRCHNAPEGFSPSISRTVTLHMRVRANLSEADYRSLLKYLNQ